VWINPFWRPGDTRHELLIARLLHRQGDRVRVLARDRQRALTLFDWTIELVDGDITKERAR
jgi:hypothetical protein